MGNMAAARGSSAVLDAQVTGIDILGLGGTTEMHFARKIMAFVIALSVATLPVAGSASVIVKSIEIAASAQATAGTEMSAAMDGCCPDQANPCDQRSDQCPSMASCALQSVSLANVTISSLKHPALPEIPVLAFTDQATPLHENNPPFRPPRV